MAISHHATVTHLNDVDLPRFGTKKAKPPATDAPKRVEAIVLTQSAYSMFWLGCVATTMVLMAVACIGCLAYSYHTMSLMFYP